MNVIKIKNCHYRLFLELCKNRLYDYKSFCNYNTIVLINIFVLHLGLSVKFSFRRVVMENRLSGT